MHGTDVNQMYQTLFGHTMKDEHVVSTNMLVWLIIMCVDLLNVNLAQPSFGNNRLATANTVETYIIVDGVKKQSLLQCTFGCGAIPISYM